MAHLPAIFVGDAAGLDFLNSVAAKGDKSVDWLVDGEGLLDWLGQARMAPPHVLEEVRKSATPGEMDALAEEARRFREWFRGFVRRHKGYRLTPEALPLLEPLNELLRAEQSFSRLVTRSSGEGFRLNTVRRWTGAAALLLPLGKAMANLVCEEDFSNVKACEGPSCTRFFVDHTRGHARRWCSMALCGNRAKQAAHRRRATHR
jgi:predicted RNA-binding Zn ribbon-like protein